MKLKSEIQELLLSAAMQRLNLITWGASKNGCTENQAIYIKQFAEGCVPDDEFKKFLNNFNNSYILSKVLTPKMRRKYYLLKENL